MRNCSANPGLSNPIPERSQVAAGDTNVGSRPTAAGYQSRGRGRTAPLTNGGTTPDKRRCAKQSSPWFQRLNEFAGGVAVLLPPFTHSLQLQSVSVSMEPFTHAVKWLRLLALCVVLEPLVSQSANLILNGDFEQGNVLFESDYSYDNVANNVVLPGEYALAASPSDVQYNFYPLSDHTSGSGTTMLIANGYIEGGAKTLWKQTVPVDKSQHYKLSVWAANVCCTDPGGRPGRVAFFVNGQSYGQPFWVLGAWAEYTLNWLSHEAEAATIELRITTTFGSGNDVAIDDISLTRISPPELVDLVARSLVWDVEQGGVKFRISVKNGPLPIDTPFVLYWADAIRRRLGNSILKDSLPKGFDGSLPWRRFTSDGLRLAPEGATQLILSIDPDNIAGESDSTRLNNIKALRDVTVTIAKPEDNRPDRVSNEDKELIKRALRVAGAHEYRPAVITSVFRTPREQAVAMYNNFYEPNASSYSRSPTAVELIKEAKSEIQRLTGTPESASDLEKAKAKWKVLKDMKPAYLAIISQMTTHIENGMKRGDRVSRHLIGSPDYHVIDIGPRSSFILAGTSQGARFQCALDSDPLIAKTFGPILRCRDDEDGNYHIEIHQPVPIRSPVGPQAMNLVPVVERPRLDVFDRETDMTTTLVLVNGHGEAPGVCNATPVSYSFSATQGDRLRVQVRSSPESVEPTSYDPAVTVISESGEEVAFGDDSDDDWYDPTIDNLTIPKTGTYTVIVSNSPGFLQRAEAIDTFTFELELDLQPVTPTIWIYKANDSELLLTFPSGGTTLVTAPHLTGPWEVVTNAVPVEMLVDIKEANQFFRLVP